MSQPQRIQRRRTRGWKAPEGAVYVARPSVFGNPFSIKSADEADFRNPRQFVVTAFEGWLQGDSDFGDCYPERRAELLRCLPELKGKTLMCWCREGEPCHADILLKMANQETQ